jgi:hypothetical protein
MAHLVKRGRLSNRKRGETFRATVRSLVREHYIDFGPQIGVETLRQWMMADGLWIDRRHRLPSPHQPRRRRECLGELVRSTVPNTAGIARRVGGWSVTSGGEVRLAFLRRSSIFRFMVGVTAYLSNGGPLERMTWRYAGCLPSEAMAPTAGRVDLAANVRWMCEHANTFTRRHAI